MDAMYLFNTIRGSEIFKPAHHGQTMRLIGFCSVFISLSKRMSHLFNPRPHLLFRHPRPHLGGGGGQSPRLVFPLNCSRASQQRRTKSSGCLEYNPDFTLGHVLAFRGRSSKKCWFCKIIVFGNNFWTMTNTEKREAPSYFSRRDATKLIDLDPKRSI